MGVRLDWEIEAEQKHVQTAKEDALTRRQRWNRRFKILALIVLVLGVFAGIGGAIVWRLREVDNQIREMLLNTIDAEVAALRIGDSIAFAEAQRSATLDWPQLQQQFFEAYQGLKVEHDVQLTGRVLDLDVDGMRARARVEEIIDGVPYARVWFYWRYEDGWRHVPPDYTFWGAVETVSTENVQVRFQAVDEPLAQPLADRLQGWIEGGCAALACVELPTLHVEVLADTAQTIAWSPTSAWTLLVPSPHMQRARADMPFDGNMQVEAANLLADRLLAQVSNDMRPVYPADAYYLRQALVSWLVGQFVQINTNTFLIDSLVASYGTDAVGQLAREMQPNSAVSIMNSVVGTTSLEQAALDWRDYLTWRLTVEDELIGRRDEANFLTLYDTREDAVRTAAYDRYNTGWDVGRKVVTSAVPEMGLGNFPQLRATVQVGEEGSTTEQQILFRLVNGVWVRAS